MQKRPKSASAAQAASVCLCLHTRKAARAITQIFDHALAPSGLKATQLNLLMILNDQEPISPGTLAESLVTDSTTVSRNIKPLLAANLISEAANPNDRRVKMLSLTQEGLAAIENALPLWQTAQTRVARSLGGKQVQSLLPGLESAARLGSKAAN